MRRLGTGAYGVPVRVVDRRATTTPRPSTVNLSRDR